MKAASEDSNTARFNLSLAALSFASGCTDVLIFLKLGNVFTSAMTGNTALLAVEIGRGNFVAASRALTALFAFAFGVVLATKLNSSWRAGPSARRGFTHLLIVELAFLMSCTALWSAIPDPVQRGAGYAVISLSAISMGIQAVAAGSISPGINTIVFTSALVRIVMSITAALSSPAEDSPSLVAISGHLRTFALYGCGALVAAVFVWHLPRLMIWVPAVAVMFAFGVSALADKPKGSER